MIDVSPVKSLMIKEPTVQTKEKNTDHVPTPVRRPTVAVPCSGEAPPTDRASPADGWKASLFHYLLLIPLRVTGVLGSIPAGTGPGAGIWDSHTSSRGPSPALRAARIWNTEGARRLEQNLGEQRNSPGSLALLGRVVLPVVRASDVLFQFTLERPFCHINQGWQRMPGSVFCQSEGPCLRQQRFIREKLAISVEAKVAGPHS